MTSNTENPIASPKEVRDWFALRAIFRSGNISYQNWKDARRLNGRETEEESEKRKTAMDDEMKINSPETHHHYPNPPAPQSLLKPLAGLAAATVLGGSGLGAAYMVADAILKKPVPASIDTDSTLIQEFDSQDADWLKDE